MYTENSEVPKWAKTLFEGLIKMNGDLVKTVKGLQERQNAIEARMGAKPPEKEETQPEQASPDELAKVMETLFV